MGSPNAVLEFLTLEKKEIFQFEEVKTETMSTYPFDVSRALNVYFAQYTRMILINIQHV